MPLEFRARIRTLLPYVAPNHAIANLVYSPKDGNPPTAGSSSAAACEVFAVQNKPWEWTEYLGDAPGADTVKENVVGGQHSSDQPTTLIGNYGSLSLDLFNASVVGKLVQADEDVMLIDPRVEGNLRMLQDDAFTESVFKRDFRETRIDPAVLDARLAIAKSADQDGDTNGGAAVGSGSERHSSSRIASPAGSVRSRGSMQPPSLPSGSRRTSPVTHSSQHHAHSGLSRLSGSSAGEAIDVDSLDIPTSTTNTAGTKRKTAEPDDDEVQILEGPVTSMQSKKVKGKAKLKNR